MSAARGVRGYPKGLPRTRGTPRTRLAAVLKHLRHKHRLLQNDIAEIAGCHPRTIQNAEQGKCTPKPETLEKLAEHFGLLVGEFFDPPTDCQARKPDGTACHRSIMHPGARWCVVHDPLTALRIIR